MNNEKSNVTDNLVLELSRKEEIEEQINNSKKKLNKLKNVIITGIGACIAVTGLGIILASTATTLLSLCALSIFSLVAIPPYFKTEEEIERKKTLLDICDTNIEEYRKTLENNSKEMESLPVTKNEQVVQTTNINTKKENKLNKKVK